MVFMAQCRLRTKGDLTEDFYHLGLDLNNLFTGFSSLSRSWDHWFL